MTATQNDFAARVAEIEEYYAFLEKADLDLPTLHYVDGGVTQTFPLTIDLFRILKANSFLLLYNLAESVIRNCVKEIHASLRADGLPYAKIKDEIKKLWIKNKSPSFQGAKDETVRQKLKELAHLLPSTMQMVPLVLKN